VALIAGMFEDPSAITRGWQENPVDFDTVFNQSNKVWSWGSPDILPMFAKGAHKGQVKAEMYEPSLESFFSKQKISDLDSWVFNKVRSFFTDDSEESKTELKANDDKVVLFLHLLGLDTNGHSNKPNSKEFVDNLRLVDRGVQEIVGLCEAYFRHDGRTAFIFTSDHGMTDWGSHGAGMDHETQTPILAWGAGIQRPLQKKDDLKSDAWPLFSKTKATDINQTDVAPLMSALIGTNIPQHSVGKLPLDYLALHDLYKLEAKIANGLQIHEQYLAFKERCTDSLMPRLFQRPDPYTIDELRGSIFFHLHIHIQLLGVSSFFDFFRKIYG
jgi:phosphatidylinositol glycan class N